MAAVLENEVFLRRSELVRNSPPDISLLIPRERKWTPVELHGVDFSQPEWEDNLQKIREETRDLSDDVVISLFYHGGTEGALPSYLARLQMYDATKDFSGTDEEDWPVWARGWTAEEHDHDVYHRDYMYLSGRVRIAAFDKAAAYLIRRGFNMRVKDPVGFGLYVVWQETNTGEAHGNTGDEATKQGAKILAKGLKVIASDERRHAEAYMRSMDKVLAESPDDVVIVLEELLSERPEMPTKNMEGFGLYGQVVFWNGIFTARVLVDTEEKMIDRFKIHTLHGLSSEAEEARDKLLILHEKNAKRAVALEERRLEGRVKKPDLSQFDWLISQEAA